MSVPATALTMAAIAKKSQRAAKAILTDLEGRRGIRQAVDECDAETIKEIKTTIANLVYEEMVKSCPGNA